MISRNILVIAVLLIVSTSGFIFWQKYSSSSKQQAYSLQNADKKEYRLRTGKVVVVDTQTNKETVAIDLSAKEGDFTIIFTPHNVTVTPDKKQVWVTATASEEQFQAISKESLEHTHLLTTSDQIIVVSTETNTVVKRINFGMQLRLADLIITPEGKYIYVSAEKASAIYRIATETYKVDLILLPPESNPHQLALSTDGTKLYTRNQENSNARFISIKTSEVKNQQDTEEIKNLKWSSH